MKRVVVGVCVLAAVLASAGPTMADDGIDTNTITDSASTNTVRIVTLMLAVAGIVMAALTAWYWRGTRPDPDALGPLLVMSRRGFDRLDPIEQRRQLDEFRPGIVTEAPDEPSLPEMLPPTDDVAVSSVAASAETTTGPAVTDDDEFVDDRDDDVDARDLDDVDSRDLDDVDARDLDDDWPDLDDWGGFDVVDDDEDREPVERRNDFDEVPDVRDESDSRSSRRSGPIDPLLG